MTTQQTPPPGYLAIPQWQKPEGLVGNILEFFFSYGAGLIYASTNWFIIFGPIEWDTPEKQAAFWPLYIYGTLIYLASQFVAGIVGTQARFTTKVFRMLSDIGASGSNLLVVGAVFFLGVVGKTFHPAGVDVDVTFVSLGVTLLDLFGIGLLGYIGLRRVEERYGENR